MSLLKYLPLVALIPAGAAGQAPAQPGSLARIFASPLASSVAQADSGPGSCALPQLAFGGGWYTALYFSNPTDAAATVTVKFIGSNGAPLSVPVVGAGPVTEQNLNLAPRATVIVEAPNTGPLQQGWVEATLTGGVIGYGVFRQSQQGRADQEAVVPLSDQSSQMADLTWDDTVFTTGVALVNTGTAAAAISITAYADNGTTIGTTTVNLGARGKTAFVLREQPGLAGMVAKRGFARFSVTTGSIAVLGLRFGGEAFTSIPVTYR